VIISDKLSESETQKLVATLEKYRSVIGYSLKDLKGNKITFPWNRITYLSRSINAYSIMR
jgi:hypothetical protein